VSDKRCDDRECRVPPAYGAVLDTTRRGRDCAVRCSAVRGAGIQLLMRWETPGRVFIGSRQGTGPGGEEKVDRRPNPTRHPGWCHAGQTARVAYGTVSPTPPKDAGACAFPSRRLPSGALESGTFGCIRI